MLGSKLEPATPEPVTGVEFTAMVGLAGSLCGVLTVRCGQQSANLIASTMLNLPPAQASEHAWDALGEVANMVAGNFKNKIDGVSDKCLLSVPTVITGAGYSFHALADAAPLELWFRFQGGLLQVTLEIQD
ncbi:MAG TPA: chemotaxis protein CheX [Candidatus Sulfotelmatobacter sp.]|nr:chemotaxis protein CheX [Candidatus Sulfotelmatobacter sp.]